MSGTVVGGVYYNTDSGLSPMLDRLTGMLDKDRQQRDQLAGIAPALAATGVSLPQQPQGILGGMLSSLGIGGATQQQPLPSPQAPQTAASAASAGAATPQTSAYRGPAPGFDNAVTRTLDFEGKLNPRDTNNTPSMYGINQAAHPDIDVASLTPDAAKGIYKSQYWDAIGADSMPPALSRAAFDTAVIAGPGKAKELLAASGGDPMKLMDLREQFQNGLVQSDPQKYGRYAKAWSSRNNGLRLDIAALNAGGGGTGGMPAGASAYAPQSTMPGTTDAGADVAAAGINARTAAGYGSTTGVSTGAQAAAATGSAPMPIASASLSAMPTMQAGRAPGAAPAPALGTAAGVTRAPLGGITNEALGAMIANPASREIGLKLWQTKLTGKDFGFQVTSDGTVIRTDKETGAAVPVYQAPVKQGFQELNGRLLATDPLSGTARDATPAGMPQGYRPATPQEREAYGVQADAPLFIGPDNKPGTLNSGVNVVNNMATNPVLEGLGKQFVGQRGEADSAAKSLPIIADARALLKSGIFAGTGAPQVMAMQKLAIALGLPGADASRITKTEQFSAATKPLVLQLVKNLGSGSGITDADVRFINEAVGADKTLEPASMLGILDRLDRSARSKINDYNTLADQMIKTPGGDAYKHILPMMHIRMPDATALDPANTRTIGGQTYTKGPDGHWYTGQ